MSDWQPPQNPTGPIGSSGSGPPPGQGQGFGPPPGSGGPPPPPGQGYGPPPGAGGPPPPPGQGYGYSQPTSYQPGGYPPGAGYGGPPFAGFGARLGAWLLDGLILAIPFAIAVIALTAGPKGGIHTCTINDEPRLCRSPSGASWAIFGLFITAGVLFSIYYLVFLLGRTGQTIGRKAVGIKVVDKATGQPIGPGRAFVRLLVRSVASGNICLLGYLWMLWDEEKQTWHDKAANSYVINA